MYYLEKIEEFDKWLRKLKDNRAKAKILFRLQKIGNDEHFGDNEHVGNGIFELKIDYSKGYRVYFTKSNGKIIILLVGGDKSTQKRDIEKSRYILKRIKK